MGKISDLQIEIESCYDSGMSVEETARRLGISVAMVNRAYRDLLDEVYMDQEERSYVNSYVGRYNARAEAGHDWD